MLRPASQATPQSERCVWRCLVLGHFARLAARALVRFPGLHKTAWTCHVIEALLSCLSFLDPLQHFFLEIGVGLRFVVSVLHP